MKRNSSSPKTGASQGRTRRRIAIHIVRVMMFAVIILLIHLRAKQLLPKVGGTHLAPIDMEAIRTFFPEAEGLSAEPVGDDASAVLDADNTPLGYVVQTSPQCDSIVGFSGPTNTLLAFGEDDTLLGIAILSSGDTIDHVKHVKHNEAFMQAFDGLSWEEAAAHTEVDAVSEATLTSLAIHESILKRLGGEVTSLRFTDAPMLKQAQVLFPKASWVLPDPDDEARWYVRNGDIELGTIISTSPAADNETGYNGPTNTLIGLDLEEKVVGISIAKSYDNEPYVGYVQDDAYFLNSFNGKTLSELEELDLFEARVEGVSGATMTSLTAAEGLILAAARRQALAAELESKPPVEPVAPVAPRRPLISWSWQDIGTAIIIGFGILFGLTSLKSMKKSRLVFQCVLIVYLGFVTGNMISQAMFVGWAKNGVPWRVAPGLLMLTVAAFLLPMATGRNIYCDHLCPHGAVQQLIKRRLKWQWKVPRKLSRAMLWLPGMLLVWCAVVALLALPFSLVDIEPFDAWVYEVAGWATITVAIVGLVASLFVPMAYCRYGCPTGALLKFLRFHGRSDCWTRRDSLVAGMVALAALTLLLPMA